MGIAVTYWKQENVWGGEITCVGGILAVLWWIPKFLQKETTLKLYRNVHYEWPITHFGNSLLGQKIPSHKYVVACKL